MASRWHLSVQLKPSDACLSWRSVSAMCKGTYADAQSGWIEI